MLLKNSLNFYKDFQVVCSFEFNLLHCLIINWFQAILLKFIFQDEILETFDNIIKFINILQKISQIFLIFYKNLLVQLTKKYPID